jgi:hypothetical protein
MSRHWVIGERTGEEPYIWTEYADVGRSHAEAERQWAEACRRGHLVRIMDRATLDEHIAENIDECTLQADDGELFVTPQAPCIPWDASDLISVYSADK